ncbi:MAG: hypothetical protein NVSMB59_08000 [Vulcanimicrobiaceae bacterium]
MIRSFRIGLFAIAALVGVAGFARAQATPGAPDTNGNQPRTIGRGNVVVVAIEGTVDGGMAHLVARAVREAEASHAEALVLDVNTPGGLVSAAFEIRDALLGARVPTLAYVSQRAYSAGALITLAARTIVMAPGSSIGSRRRRRAITATRRSRRRWSIRPSMHPASNAPERSRH